MCRVIPALCLSDISGKYHTAGDAEACAAVFLVHVAATS